MPQFSSSRWFKFLAFIFVALLLAGSAQAQSRSKKPRTAARPDFSPPLQNSPAAQLTRQLEYRLCLYEHQFIQLLPLSRSYLREQAEISQRLADNAGALAYSMGQLNAAYELSYRQILSSWQVVRLQKDQAVQAPGEAFAHFLATHL